MIFGLDVLGLAKFKDVAIRNFPRGFACGFFAEEFGDAWLGIEQLVKTGKTPAVRCQALWTNHTYDQRRHDPLIMKHLQRANALKAKFPATRVLFSPVCEHNIRGQQLKNLLDRCGEASRDVEIVNNPFQGDFSDRFMNEIHGDKGAPSNGAYLYSYDGDSIVDSDLTADRQKYGNAQIFFAWHPAFNCKYKTALSADKHEPPHVIKNDSSPGKARNCLPTKELFQSIAAVLNNSRGETRLGPKDIWKSHADRNNTPVEPRAYRPVYISPNRVDRITLVDKAGRLRATSLTREAYVDGRFMYRFSKFGYQIGLEPLKIMGGGRELAVVNPCFRDGSFR